MSAIDDLFQRHLRREHFHFDGPTSPVPSLHLAVVTCMDARIPVFDVLGLNRGEVHILRNAGGVVTDDTIRSLSISQRKLATREVLIIQHTGCGMATFTDDEFKDEMQEDTGLRPTWATEAFRDVENSVWQSVQRVRRSPFLELTTEVRGFVLDIQEGDLHEVTAPEARAAS
ncbi:carbonic anhydrase [Pseudonocardiaceae bacterium YIM PH 21723]|nr:carbonic anhydrase [Pseudonocardiaceae bacterium YIM PH 21723]